MSTFLRRAALCAVAVASTVPSAFADWAGSQNVSDKIKPNNDTLDVAAQDIVAKAMGFLGILAVLYAIWGGFQIMSANGDDEKVKSGKKVLIQAAIGLVVIFLANSIVMFVLNNLLGGK